MELWELERELETKQRELNSLFGSADLKEKMRLAGEISKISKKLAKKYREWAPITHTIPELLSKK